MKEIKELKIEKLLRDLEVGKDCLASVPYHQYETGKNPAERIALLRKYLQVTDALIEDYSKIYGDSVEEKKSFETVATLKKSLYELVDAYNELLHELGWLEFVPDDLWSEKTFNSESLREFILCEILAKRVYPHPQKSVREYIDKDTQKFTVLVKDKDGVVKIDDIVKFCNREFDCDGFDNVATYERDLEYLTFLLNCKAVADIGSDEKQYRKTCATIKEKYNKDMEDITKGGLKKLLANLITRLMSELAVGKIKIGSPDVNYCILALTKYNRLNGRIVLGRPSSMEQILIDVINHQLLQVEYQAEWQTKKAEQ